MSQAGFTPRPDPEVEITADLVRDLLSDQHPDLAGEELRFVDDGWDNVVFRLGRELAVRLPRRASAHALLLNELRWLPFLAPRLPVSVPVPVRRGKPGAGYPYHWAIVPWFQGSSAALIPALERDGYALELAGFFKALHVPSPADAPVNPVRGVPLCDRDAVVRARLRDPDLPEAAALLDLWDVGLRTALHRGPRLWLHGDPHPHNVVVDIDALRDPQRPGVGLRAVIDLGDVTSGDPASDLGVAWLHFTAEGRKIFREHLAGHALYSPGTWDRARGWAVNYASIMVQLPESDPLHAVGAHGIEQLMIDAQTP